jgi:beta-glucosidase
MADLVFPEGFLWGVATAAYQIEGAVGDGGRGESIWDRFSHTPGRVQDGDTGDVACDHYRRWPRDVELMAELGVRAYRFSIAWPRVMPSGRGPVNREGLDFYADLVDALLEVGIVPFPTLYHWDLPQALEDEGGWPARATAEAFADYAAVVVEHLGDRVGQWMTINEPWVAATMGYVTGLHAPGRMSLADGLRAAHHLLLGHGLAVRRIREVAPAARVGIVLNQEYKQPASAHLADLAESRLEDGLMNRWYADPVAGRGYPEDVVEHLGWDRDPVRDGDLEVISAPLDQVGLNYYTRSVVAAASVDDGERPGERVRVGREHTEMGWEVAPSGLVPLLTRLAQDYAFPRFYVTESGAAYPDQADADGFVDDADRISYLRRHFVEAHRAITEGVPLAGYFVWSLIDNFEWGFGYSKRFGIVRVDYETQRRIPKASAHWYRDVIAANAVR